MRINGCGVFMIPLLLLLTVFLGYSIRSAPWCREHGSKDESYYTLILIIRTAILADTRVPQKRHFRPASAHFIMKRQPPGIITIWLLIGALFRTWMNMNRNLLLLGRFFTANCQFNYTGSLFIENHGPMNTNQIDVVIMWAIIPLLLFKVIHRIRLLDLLSTKDSHHSRSEVWLT